jgi:hypothetical protein
MKRLTPAIVGLELRSLSATYIVKVCSGFEAPSIAPPFTDIRQALRWIAGHAWNEFDGDADRADVFEFEGMNRRLALREARAGYGKLVRTVQRPPTPEQCRRAARAADGGAAENKASPSQAPSVSQITHPYRSAT